jgi:hypothetical protein
MTPFELEALIDDHGTAMDRWPDAERAAARHLLATSEDARAVLRRAERLEALLCIHESETADEPPGPEDILRVIARTQAAAYRTPQLPPPLLVRWSRWCARLKAELWAGFQSSDLGLRYGVPVAVGLVLGVLVGHVSVDPMVYTDAADTEVTPTVETLITASQSTEPFGL